MNLLPAQNYSQQIKSQGTSSYLTNTSHRGDRRARKLCRRPLGNSAQLQFHVGLNTTNAHNVCTTPQFAMAVPLSVEAKESHSHVRGRFSRLWFFTWKLEYKLMLCPKGHYFSWNRIVMQQPPSFRCRRVICQQNKNLKEMRLQQRNFEKTFSE